MLIFFRPVYIGSRFMFFVLYKKADILKQNHLNIYISLYIKRDIYYFLSENVLDANGLFTDHFTHQFMSLYVKKERRFT